MRSPIAFGRQALDVRSDGRPASAPSEPNALSAPSAQKAPSELPRPLAQRASRGFPSLGHGVAALLAAVPLAYLIHWINQAWSNQPERAVQLTGALFAILLVGTAGGYVLVRGRSAHPGQLGLIVLSTVGILLTGTYFYWVSFQILFPADFLIWSEGDFVNDILKFLQGYPLYSAQENNESFTYMPGSQLLTYCLAWLLGNATLIPLYRGIQLGFTLLASVVALVCCRRILESSRAARPDTPGAAWGWIWLPGLFLLATNALTNPFVHNLHNDALSQLLSVTAFWLTVEYAATRRQGIVALMALFPALGFLVRQSLLIWGLLFGLQLMVFDQPRSWRRLGLFAGASCLAVGIVLAGCYLLWQEHFVYWIFTVLGSHGVSLLRSFRHLLDVWPFYVVGLAGGLVLLRGKGLRPLLGPWSIWLLFLLSETYTAGIAWMRNHMGPGSLVAGIWFFAGLARVWPAPRRGAETRTSLRLCLRTGMAVALICLLFTGLGVVRIPMPSLSSETLRYVKDIEAEFAGLAADKVLLDVGSWVYLPHGVVMKDRAPCIGERGYSETGDFSGILRRLRAKHYVKILVRDLDAEELWYDYFSWRTSSGIRQALRENYREVGQIAAVAGEKSYLFRKINILVPRAD